MASKEKEVEKMVEEKVEKGVTKVVTGLVSAAVSFAISVVVIKFVWAWVVSDLFPGAVGQGLINAELTWLDTVKFTLFVVVLSGAYHTLMDSFNRQK